MSILTISLCLLQEFNMFLNSICANSRFLYIIYQSQGITEVLTRKALNRKTILKDLSLFYS